MIAAVCGDTVVWKPSSQTPLTAIAVTRIVQTVAAAHGVPGLFGLAVGPGSVIGERMSGDARIPLVSITGSVPMGRRVARAVGDRLGRTILELGGNNAVIVLDDADLELALRAVVFAAVGTSGQRCTSTRRLIMQKGIAGRLTDMLANAYRQVRIGNPLESGTLMGPLVDQGAVSDMMKALEAAKAQGGEIVHGGRKLEGKNYAGGCYVEPTLVKARKDMPILREETFAPVLYLVDVKDLDEAIQVQNDVPQGLSSAIFSRSLQATETFLSARGSDCGIANVNMGTSGAEIGGAFGGEKETGGGREAGSDSWKAYMRRQTTTVNWGDTLPLAQGIKFDL
jgi:aldehyde dehydrogenase (NAD+)